MKKSLLVAVTVFVLVILVLSAEGFWAYQVIAKQQRLQLLSKPADNLIIDQQLSEVYQFSQQIEHQITRALLHEHCIAEEKRQQRSYYASFLVSGQPLPEHLADPQSDSGCHLLIVFGQGEVDDSAADIKNKRLYLYFTNGGKFLVDPKYSTLQKRYWPHW
jgi:hypothetical protein